ncbi:hypothetical protein QJQ45_013870, partial [Haematococcus lacustris]
EYKLQGQGLEAQRGGAGAQGGGGGGGGGVRVSGGFGAPPPVPGRPPSRGGQSGRSAAPSVMDSSQRELAHLRSIEASDGGGGSGISGPLSEAHLAALEDAIRDAVRAHRSVYESSKEMLLKLFKAVDDGSGDVSQPEFSSVCAQVGVTVSDAEARALFRRFGYDTALPYERFAHMLLTQPARQLAEDLPTRKGAFTAGSSAQFNGKILYRHCRKPVYTPSDWDPGLAERSSDLPSARLVLDFVYGYQGKENTSQNLFYTSEGKLVYYTAGVGVVYQRPPVHHQHFFLGHSDDITALALCPAAAEVEGRQYPARCLVATGQVTSTEEGPCVCVWDSRLAATGSGPAATTEVARLKFDKEARGITALAFSPTGTRLAAVATDNQHTVYVYDWRKARLLSSGKGQMGDPPQARGREGGREGRGQGEDGERGRVYGVEWNPYEVSHSCPCAFVTFGRKHLKLWTCDAASTTWASKQLSFGKLPMQNVTSAQWLPPRSGSECLLVAGVADGSLYLYKGSAAIRCVAAHRPGPQVIQADGHPSFTGVRGLRVCKDNKVLLSGGADGVVLQWDASDGSLAESRFAGPSMQLKSPFGAGDKWAPAIRALDYSPELQRIVVGTRHCDIIELTETSTETLLDGHSGDVYQLASHPSQPHIMATVADSGHVHLWDCRQRQMTHCVAVGFVPRALAFSAAPVPSSSSFHVAVGGVKGQLKVLDQGSHLRPLHQAHDSKEGVSDIKYSPNNRFLAVATFDTWIDLYNVDKGYSRMARCSGHSATVRGLDWSTDSSMVQTASADLELLLWNARTAKQITLPQRDAAWATYTVALGFSVMGIFPPFADGTEINSVDRSKDQKFIVTADDHGMVKMFNYPCVVEDAPHRAYRGHSSHVMGVRFNADDSLVRQNPLHATPIPPSPPSCSYASLHTQPLGDAPQVCSAGGHDWAIFQFRVVHITPTAAPPPRAEPVWGPLDPSGKSYGYTTTPAVLSATARSEAARNGQARPREAAPESRTAPLPSSAAGQSVEQPSTIWEEDEVQHEEQHGSPLHVEAEDEALDGTAGFRGRRQTVVNSMDDSISLGPDGLGP